MGLFGSEHFLEALADQVDLRCVQARDLEKPDVLKYVTCDLVAVKMLRAGLRRVARTLLHWPSAAFASWFGCATITWQPEQRQSFGRWGTGRRDGLRWDAGSNAGRIIGGHDRG